MPIRIEDDVLTFSSGRKAYVNRGIVGLSDDFIVWEGGDAPLASADDKRKLDPSDMRELADYMIRQWTVFKNTVAE